MARNAITKRALMVERVGGPLSNLTPAIQKSGCEVARAAEARAAVTLVGTMRRLSLLAVNGDTVANEAGWLIASIKGQHPDLPILWFSTDPKAAASLPNKIDLVTNDLKKLEARITCLLREEFYSQSFVQQVIVGARSVLAEFALVLQASEPCVKSDLSNLSEVNTFLSFSGPRMTGHIILSASSGDLTSAYRAQFPKIKFPGMDDVEDLLGEIANQVVGQIKRTIQPDGGECRLGLPLFIRGDGVNLRHRAGAPSLAIDLSNTTQKVHLELCIHRSDGGTVTDGGAADPMKPGTINFL